MGNPEDINIAPYEDLQKLSPFASSDPPADSCFPIVIRWEITKRKK
jgi:hypothetical protein